MAYAIIQDSGTQFKVQAGDTLTIDPRTLPPDAATITFEKVLLVSNDQGVKIGQPFLNGASVTARILGTIKDRKVYVERLTKRKGFHRRVGHRQRYLAVRIETLS
ncbi:MAG: 50S ribosomal protein L21 [Planctomycetes bacterium]|nr:50S ribosomal protein L21 [Planctomycetota bacterium]